MTVTVTLSGPGPGHESRVLGMPVARTRDAAGEPERDCKITVTACQWLAEALSLRLTQCQ